MPAALRALRAVLVFTLLTGLLYPLTFTLGAQIVFPDQAGGSLIEIQGETVGSELVGQAWAGEEWFYGRPSAVDYDASASGASNLGPTSADLSQQISERVEAIATLEEPYRGEVSAEDIPVDLLAASASGLDPHVSVEAARFQAPRIAEVRGLTPARVQDLIAEHTESKGLGVLGQERVNVLRLNLALQAMPRT